MNSQTLTSRSFFHAQVTYNVHVEEMNDRRKEEASKVKQTPRQRNTAHPRHILERFRRKEERSKQCQQHTQGSHFPNIRGGLKFGPIYLGEVPDHVTALRVKLGHDVEEERLHIKVERLVLEEELGHETETLAVDLVLLPVHLKHRGLPVPVDLPAWRVTPRAHRLK